MAQDVVCHRTEDGQIDYAATMHTRDDQVRFLLGGDADDLPPGSADEEQLARIARRAYRFEDGGHVCPRLLEAPRAVAGQVRLKQVRHVRRQLDDVQHRQPCGAPRREITRVLQGAGRTGREIEGTQDATQPTEGVCRCRERDGQHRA
jgi:hypothetical protein